jgi:hypothetical protein
MTIDFDDNQLQYLVNTLAQRPYGEVFEIINSIQRQVAQARQPQLQAVQPPGPTQQELVGT